MLRRIEEIRNVGRFDFRDSEGGAEFGKLTLMFGNNGTGKSTLAAIFKAQSDEDNEVIKGRTALGCDGAPSILIEFDAGAAKYVDGRWNGAGYKTRVFDSFYVDENLSSGGVVNLEHKKNLVEMFIGKANVALASEIDELNEKVTELRKQGKEFERELENRIEGKMALETFLKLPFLEDIEVLIGNQMKEIASLSEKEKIASWPILRKPSMPQFPVERFKDVLGLNAAPAPPETTEKVREHINSHLGPKGGVWIRYGLEHIDGSSCPFCREDLSGSAMVSAYRDYFDETYKIAQKNRDALSDEITSDFSDEKIRMMKEILEGNTLAATFWSVYENLQIPRLDFDSFQNASITLREKACEQLTLKEREPGVSFVAGEEIGRALESLESFRKKLFEYCEAVEAANNRIEQIKSDLRAKPASQAEEELNTLLNARIRHSESVEKLCAARVRVKNESERADAELKRRRNDLKRRNNALLEDCQNRINSLLKLLGVRFRICRVEEQFYGGGSVNYHLLINRKEVALGSKNTGRDSHSFGNTLSDAEKRLLALTFMISSIENDEEAGNLIVVLDDPATGLDTIRKFRLAGIVETIFNRCRQVIVLSHDAEFLKSLSSITSGNDTVFLSLSEGAGGALKIIKVDEAAEVLLDSPEDDNVEAS